MAIVTKPNTFYELTRRDSGKTDYFYYSPRGYMISLHRTRHSFTEYRLNDSDYFDGSRYSSGRECGEMQVYWIYDAWHDYTETLVCPSPDFPEVKKYYEQKSGSSVFLHTLSDFHSVLTTRGLEQVKIPEIGCITEEVIFLCKHSPIYKLISKDFFSDQEICRLYGITDLDIAEYFLSGYFQSWEGLPQDHCFYRYGSYVFYISSRRKLAEEDTEPCWFKWTEDHNCYVQVYFPGHIICAKAKPMPEEPTIGCVDNGFSDKIELALREGKLGNGMCSLGEALARVMGNSTDNVIFVGGWEFILDYENRRIQYFELRAFEDKTEWPFLEMADWISFE